MHHGSRNTLREKKHKKKHGLGHLQIQVRPPENAYKNVIHADKCRINIQIGLHPSMQAGFIQNMPICDIQNINCTPCVDIHFLNQCEHFVQGHKKPSLIKNCC